MNLSSLMTDILSLLLLMGQTHPIGELDLFKLASR